MPLNDWERKNTMQTRLSLCVALLTCSLLLPLAVTGQKSTSGATRATLTFENQTDLPLNINWIDYAGVEAFNKSGVIGPYESWAAGQVQSGTVYRVRIDDPQCDPLKRVKVKDFTVAEEPDQTFRITPADINPEKRLKAKSHACED